jgi:hypothetical protein
MTEIMVSKNGVPIRLTDERWVHITEEHNELAGMRLEILETIAVPPRFLLGIVGSYLLSVRSNQANILSWCTGNFKKTALLSPHFSPEEYNHFVGGN